MTAFPRISPHFLPQFSASPPFFEHESTAFSLQLWKVLRKNATVKIPIDLSWSFSGTILCCNTQMNAMIGSLDVFEGGLKLLLKILNFQISFIFFDDFYPPNFIIDNRRLKSNYYQK